jgi:hypothetical protein
MMTMARKERPLMTDEEVARWLARMDDELWAASDERLQSWLRRQRNYRPRTLRTQQERDLTVQAITAEIVSRRKAQA